MVKEPYVKPEVKSEVLEPEALTGGGSGVGSGTGNGNSVPCPPGVCD